MRKAGLNHEQESFTCRSCIAVAAGIGAAAVMAGKRRSKKEEENSDYRNTELGKFAKNSKGIY